MNYILAQGSPFDPFEKGKGKGPGDLPAVPEPGYTGALIVGIMLVMILVGRWWKGRRKPDERWD